MSDIVDTGSSGEVKPCPLCGEEIKAVAVKCRFCGEDLVAYAKRQAAAVETMLYQGRRPLLYSAGHHVLLVILLIIGVLPGLVYLVVRWIRCGGVAYRISSQRISIERGIFSRTGETIELFRIDDIGVDEPFGMRLAGYANMVFKASDRTSGNIIIVIKKKVVEALLDNIRNAVFAQRELRSIRTFTES